MDSTQRPSSSEILNRLISPNGIEASDIAIAPSHLSATEDLQPELFPPPSTHSPTYGDVKEKRKGSPTRACDTDAAIETGAFNGVTALTSSHGSSQ